MSNSGSGVANSNALHAAAGGGHLSVVETLLPYSDPKSRDSIALRMAAVNGQMDVVAFLIPHSDPKTRHSEALCWALEQGHMDVVDVLWDASDPKDALWYMKKQGFPSDTVFYIKERLMADKSRAELNNGLQPLLGEKCKTTPKHKM